jgi:hypothetical protein
MMSSENFNQKGLWNEKDEVTWETDYNEATWRNRMWEC